MRWEVSADKRRNLEPPRESVACTADLGFEFNDCILDIEISLGNGLSVARLLNVGLNPLP